MLYICCFASRWPLLCLFGKGSLGGDHQNDYTNAKAKLKRACQTFVHVLRFM